jgi:hypothetical protein
VDAGSPQEMRRINNLIQDLWTEPGPLPLQMLKSWAATEIIQRSLEGRYRFVRNFAYSLIAISPDQGTRGLFLNVSFFLMLASVVSLIYCEAHALNTPLNCALARTLHDNRRDCGSPM